MNKPHKHADLIKAWADGAQVEYFSSWHSKWVPCHSPLWDCDKDYRIKPEPKPDVVIHGCANTNGIWNISMDRKDRDNLKLTFDGETYRLKAAEVIA